METVRIRHAYTITEDMLDEENTFASEWRDRAVRAMSERLHQQTENLMAQTLFGMGVQQSPLVPEPGMLMSNVDTGVLSIANNAGEFTTIGRVSDFTLNGAITNGSNHTDDIRLGDGKIVSLQDLAEAYLELMHRVEDLTLQVEDLMAKAGE